MRTFLIFLLLIPFSVSYAQNTRRSSFGLNGPVQSFYEVGWYKNKNDSLAKFILKTERVFNLDGRVISEFDSMFSRKSIFKYNKDNLLSKQKVYLEDSLLSINYLTHNGDSIYYRKVSNNNQSNYNGGYVVDSLDRVISMGSDDYFEVYSFNKYSLQTLRKIITPSGQYEMPIQVEILELDSLNNPTLIKMNYIENKVLSQDFFFKRTFTYYKP
jgi:hypothetical protein